MKAGSSQRREEPILRLGMPNPLPTSFFLPQRKSWPPAGGALGGLAQTGWHRNQTDRELGRKSCGFVPLHGPISSWLASVPLAPGGGRPYLCRQKSRPSEEDHFQPNAFVIGGWTSHFSQSKYQTVVNFSGCDSGPFWPLEVYCGRNCAG